MSLVHRGARVRLRRLLASLAMLVRSGQITRRLAESRSSTPEELGRLLGAATLDVDRRVAA